ncbi:glutaredoxin family protein [Peribacillus kribbensis]|uniref:glutaredoxin family protein n=1 Tax=Peribacillus kribbensis TaxID=356658 RepID=UPI000425F252|nr:glutaredoxin family protein [Peribacillus kribbensis]
MTVIQFYTREKCPLCVKAKGILNDLQPELGFEIDEIDIYSDDGLIERFGLMIPVIEHDGKIVQYGQVNKEEIRKRFQKKS